MTRIGLLSDTHGVVSPQVYDFFASCDQLWHAGDIGPGVLEQLEAFKPVKAVYGNTDGWDVRDRAPRTQLFTCDGQKVLMTHIGGYPGHYDASIRPLLQSERPNIFIAGHSHILRVMYDRTLNLLHINPCAAGREGFHRVCTLVRFVIDGEPKQLEIKEFPKFPSAT